MLKWIRGVLFMKRDDLASLIYQSNEGNLDAKTELGLLYYHGIGMKKDPDKARAIWQECINQDNDRAIITMASTYILENKVEQAIPFLEKGDHLEIGEASYILASLYQEQDEKKALYYLDRAVLQKNPDACYQKALLIDSEEEKIRLLTPIHTPDSFYALGVIYLYSEKHQDYKEALKLFKMAFKGNNYLASIQLANIYINGLGCNKNMNEAARMLTIASQKGIKEAYFNLANMYFHGEGVKQNYKEALRLFKLSSNELSDIDSKHNIGMMTLNGLGTTKNIDEGLRLLKYCALHGSVLSLQNLIEYYKTKDQELFLEYTKQLEKLKNKKESI